MYNQSSSSGAPVAPPRSPLSPVPRRRSSAEAAVASSSSPAAAPTQRRPSGAAAGGASTATGSGYASPYYHTAAGTGSSASTAGGGYYTSGVVAPSGGSAVTQAPLSPSAALHSPYTAAAAAWAPSSSTSNACRSSLSTGQQTPAVYAHNVLTACFWFPCWIVVFLAISSSHHQLPRQTFCFFGLIAYALDLANWRDGALYMIWLATLMQSIISLWFCLWTQDDDNATVLTGLLEASVVALFYVVTACWATLQCQWLTGVGVVERNNGAAGAAGSSSASQSSNNNNNSSMPRQLESALHALLPVVFAALATVFLSQQVVQRQFGTDAACTAAPLLFAATLAAAMLFVGSAESSFATGGGGSEPFSTSRHNGNNNSVNDDDDDKNHGSAAAVYYVIRQRVAWGHVVLLLLVPPIMHLTLFGGRIVSRYASTDDLCDFLLSLTAPCVLLSAMHWLHQSNLRYSPYAGVLQLSNGEEGRQRFLISTVIPFGAIVLTSVVLQLRYLIPMCHRFAYHFVGVQFPTWLLTLYWTIATISMLAAGFFWGRVSATTGQPLFGEYHEDFVQLCLAVSGLCLGKAVGLPWNMTPLPILGILGLSLWMYTRMMRYLAIFLFVVHATGVVVFTYRFVGIDQVLSLPLPGVELSLTRFGMVVIFASILIGLVVGLAVRSTGGYMARMLKMVDAAGMFMIAYTVLLTILEIALMKRPVPTKELAGVQLEEDETEEMLYGQGLVFLTSALLIGISLFMKRVRILQERSAVVVVSLAIGKAVAVFIETAETESGGASKGDPSGTAVLLRALVASLLCAVMFAPRVFLQPVHVKSPTGRQRRSFSGGPDLPKSAMRMIFLYAFVFLPVTLIVTIPYVLFPLINVLAGIYRNESYYSVSTPVSELLGAAMCLWGLACISMLNFYLPDGGGAAWKKLSALAFLMGIGIIFTAPTMGMSVGKAANSPYASMSSLGSQLISRSKSRTGGWGILSAALATLLAVLGPLELKERRDTSGRKDKYLLFRTMVFSLLFGGGVSWFITVQSMSEAQWLFLVLTLIASMALAFLGTVAAVLGHFVEPENFDEVEMVARTWFVALVAFLPISGIPQLFRSGSVVHPFGVGGWLSTYLTVASLSALSFSLSLSFRHGKDQQTRGLGNIGCLVSWICAIAVLYGRFGVAGLDTNFNVSSIAGIPATIIGTLLVGTVLLALEGETSSQARGRRVSVTTSHKGNRSSLRLNLPQLTRGNRWFPPFVLTVTVFLVASLYTVLLRGSGLLPFSGSVARSHEDVFANVFGSAASVSDEAHDLATLAEKSVSHSLALTTSAKLAGSGFWTAKGFFGPLLHLAGVFATLPSLFLLVNQYWLGLSVPSAQVTVGLPLNIIPVALCRGIPVLQAAALLVVAGAVAQLLLRRQVEQISKMRL